MRREEESEEREMGFEELEAKIGWEFRDRKLLENAMVAPSMKIEHPDMQDNQRLEFLGDAVFGLLAADAVYAANPEDQEGALTVRRTRLISGAALAEKAEELELRKYLRHNHRAQALPERAKPLADAMEALMGAVWLDGGLEAARGVFERMNFRVEGKINEWEANPKGHLQIRAQAMKPSRKPVYKVLKVAGVAHAPIVTMEVSVEGLGRAEATAGSKSAAEVEAAKALLSILTQSASQASRLRQNA